MHLRVKKTSDIEFSSELQVFFLVFGQGRVASARKDGPDLGGAKFMLSFPTTKHVGVDTEIGRSYADPFGLSEFERPKPVSDPARKVHAWDQEGAGVGPRSRDGVMTRWWSCVRLCWWRYER